MTTKTPEKNQVICRVWCEADCDPKEGEYGMELVSTKLPLNLDKGDDVDLIRDEIGEWIFQNDILQPETLVTLTIDETGEWENESWFKYYNVSGAEVETFEQWQAREAMQP